MRYSPEATLYTGSAFILVAWLLTAGLLSGLLVYFFAALGLTLIVFLQPAPELICQGTFN
jgi:hypothetical protein